MKKYGIQIDKQWVIHIDPGVIYENASPRLFNTMESAVEWAENNNYDFYIVKEYACLNW